MASAHPPLSWGDITSWMAANNVPGSARIHDDEENPVVHADFSPGRITLRVSRLAEPLEGLTLDELMAAVTGAGKTPECLLRFADGAPVRDLNHGEDDGKPYLVVQRRWG